LLFDKYKTMEKEKAAECYMAFVHDCLTYPEPEEDEV
jgi:hypothetical protein